jgi:pSer/pThr/pTyr-binding forkhead associated (FHA) protein
MWKLVIEDDEGKRTVVPLSRDDYTFGRQEGNTVRLTERNVSRNHARIRRTRAEDGTQSFVLEDLRSYNGVFINGLRVAQAQPLLHGDLIQIGDYRLVLEDDSVSSFDTTPIPVTAVDPSDTKATIPLAPGYRGQTLTERPNRLVMLVGPTPGVEYPLDRERLTVGRAEDSTISVNHNSVSRLHCEIHALGDGRFEIVDKGSSNGVRVNAVELRRSIIEAGDVIELGDVRFKFVGAGQVFVPGPNESQQLTAISDREAELVTNERRGGYVVPILSAGVVGALLILGVVYWLRVRAVAEQHELGTPPAETEPAGLIEAKGKCTIDDCEQSHVVVLSLPESSPWRDHPDARFITTTWADSLLKKAKADPDPASQRRTLARIIADPKVEPDQRKQVTDLMAAIAEPATSPTDLPQAPASKDAGAAQNTTVQTPTPSPRTTTPTSHTTVTNATAAAPTTPPSPAPKPASSSAVERAREAARIGDAATVRQLLEQRVRSGHATTEEANLVRAACSVSPKDKTCLADVASHYPNLDRGSAP